MKRVPWRLLTIVGDPVARAAWVTILVEVFIIRGRRRDALVPIATVGGAGLMNSVIKRLVARRRPQRFFGIAQKSSDSFPSGHANGSVTLAGTISYLIWIRTGHGLWTLVSLGAGTCLAVLIGQSRVVLWRHHPSDVVGGYVVGLLSLACTLGALRRLGWRVAAATDGERLRETAHANRTRADRWCARS